MKRCDLVLVIFLVAVFLPFILSEKLYNVYDRFYADWPFLTSFLKFAILATTGELIGLRIRKGVYFEKGLVTIRSCLWM